MRKKFLIKKEPEDTEKEGTFWNTLWIFCIISSLTLITISYFYINDFNINIKKYDTNYPWPKLSDLIPSLYILPLIFCFKLFIEFIFQGFVEFCLSKKYKQINIKNVEDKYRKKLSDHLYKIIFFTGITLFGYYVLKDLPYFPKTMGGKGYLSSMFLHGFPKSYFHQKPPLFNLYYNINLAYFLCDFIFLIISEKKSDFINMLLHHICTINLIIFSFITNYSNIGSLIIFCHMESDILGHVIKFIMQTDLPIFLIGLIGVIFISNFIYMRQYVFGEILIIIYKYITWKWGIITTMLWMFLIILYIMHFRWSIILLYKTWQIICQKKRVTDSIKYFDETTEFKRHNI